MAFLARHLRADTLDEMLDYLVDTPDGSVGILDGWQRDERGRPTALIVAQGWLGRRRLEVPIDALVEIDHELRRLVVAWGAVPLEPPSTVRRLVELGRRRAPRRPTPRAPSRRPAGP